MLYTYILCKPRKKNPVVKWWVMFYLQGYFSEPRAMFLCNDGAGHTGQFVYIKDEREEQEYLGLCEVQVFPVQSKSNVISFRNDLWIIMSLFSMDAEHSIDSDKLKFSQQRTLNIESFYFPKRLLLIFIMHFDQNTILWVVTIATLQSISLFLCMVIF